MVRSMTTRVSHSGVGRASGWSVPYFLKPEELPGPDVPRDLQGESPLRTVPERMGRAFNPGPTLQVGRTLQVVAGRVVEPGIIDIKMGNSLLGSPWLKA